MLALRSRVRYHARDAEIRGRCLPGRYDKEFKYDLLLTDGTIKTNVPESELIRSQAPKLVESRAGTK